MENGLGPIRKRLGAEEYTKNYYCTSPKKTSDVCIRKMGFGGKETKCNLQELIPDNN